MNEPKHNLKVGDKLAFRVNYGNRWRIERITKITQTGRIVCGCYTLNPDLKVRGDTGYGGPYRGQYVTADICDEVRRDYLLDTLKHFEWGSLSLPHLELVFQALKEQEHK